MRSYGKVYSTFWSDRRTATLSDRGKVLSLYLLTGPHSNGIGCYRLPDGYVSADLQWTSETVSETLSELLEAGFIDRCETSGWTLIRRFLRHNVPENPNVCKSLMPLIESVPSDLVFYQGLIDGLETVTQRHPKGFPEGFLKGLRQRMPNREPKPSLALAKPEPEPEPKPPLPVPEPGAAAAADPAVSIIELFDECRVEVFGPAMARPNPAARDLPDAREILAGNGHDVPLIRATFLAVFQGQKARGAQPAGLLRYMQKPLAEAFSKRPKASGDTAADDRRGPSIVEFPPAVRAQLRASERNDGPAVLKLGKLIQAHDPAADDEGQRYLAEHGEPRAA